MFNLSNDKDILSRKTLLKSVSLLTFSTVVSLLMPLLYKIMIDSILDTHLRLSSSALILVIVACLLGYLIMFYFGELILKYLYILIQRNIMEKVFKTSLQMKSYEYRNFDSGLVHNLYYSDCYNVASSILNYRVVRPIKLIEISLVLLIVFYIDFKLSMLALLAIPLYVLFVVINSKIRSRLNRNCIRTNDALVTTVNNFKDNISGIHLTQEHAYFEGKIQEKLDQNLSSHREYYFWFLLGEKIPALIQFVTPLIILWLGAQSVRQGAATLGTLIMFSQYIGNLFEPITHLFLVLTEYKSMRPFYDRYESFFGSASESDRELFGDVPFFLNVKDATIKNGNGDRLFSVEDLSISENGVYLIKGPNGAGKSTLLKLMCGECSPSQVDGIFEVSNQYKDQISMLQYPLFIFDGTVAENIFLDAEPARDENDLFGLRNLDKVVTSNPVNLSSGEAQKCVLLRLFNERRRCILLDEPTTNLEKKSIAALKQIVKELSNDKVVVIINHDDKFDDIARGIHEIRDGFLKKLK